MLDNSIKIHLIEEVLKVDDWHVLKELEAILKRSKGKAKAKPNNAKQRFLQELKASVKEVGLAKNGKIKLQSAKDFINEL